MSAYETKLGDEGIDWAKLIQKWKYGPSHQDYEAADPDRSDYRLYCQAKIIDYEGVVDQDL
jgi:hypothetical protein